jgi:hypothetical protein
MRGVIGLIFAFVLGLPAHTAWGDGAEVDIALVLAMDCSSSVDEEEFALQMQGLGHAFQRGDVKDAIRAGNLQRIAVSVVQWSGKGNQVTVIPWTIVASDAEADNFGARVASLNRALDPTATSISSALLYAAALLETSPRASRQVIDVSADGPNNVGPPMRDVRAKLLANGITINGLAIRNEWRNLNVYLEREVAGGEDHFVVPALDYRDYADAIYKKLLKEITGPGTS